MDCSEYLNINVLQENKLVTYKSLARSLGLHVNTAKQALYEFSKGQKNIHAIYCITGASLQNDHFNIQLTKESDLEETKKKFKKITGIHVYSVTSVDSTDFSMLYAACNDIPKLSLEDRVKCGILKNTNVTIQEFTSARLIDNKAKPVSNSKAPITAPSKIASPTTAIANKATSTSTATKRKGTLSFGPATTKKQAVATPTNNEPKPKAVQTKPSIATKTQTKNTKADHDDIEKRMAKTTLKASDIFSDDEDDNEAQEQPPQDEEDLEIEEEDVDMQDFQETKPSDIKEKQKDTPSPSPSASRASAPVGKARRKVLKKKTTKNARGLLVTEEVWELESADEEEVESKPVIAQPKPTASAKSDSTKKGAATKKPAAQSNLFSFFKKA